ncbi:MAG TPA: hypothetical protein VGF17_15470 [Phytomonospora sp.]
MTTVYQWNASAFASTPPAYIDQERHAGVRRARDLITAGRRLAALHHLAASVERQARIAGLGAIPLPICIPCGGLCKQKEVSA